jgi:nicotinate-nucleotide pyrophosphorylase (carboxylating)
MSAKSELAKAGLNPDLVQALIELALSEDLADGPDVTTLATVRDDHIATLNLVSRKPGVLAGVQVAQLVFELLNDELDIKTFAQDGESVTAGQTIFSVTGPTQTLLTAERTALNFLTHLSGIATTTNNWVKAVAGTKAKIRDTRKTIPGLRHLEKYAVTCGGGVNHRMSLNDASLIKDNHILVSGSISSAFNKVKSKITDQEIQVEVDSLSQISEAIDAGANFILLDNFSISDLKQAVSEFGSKVKFEASGGLSLEVARAVAETGVDYLAVGALTHSAPSLDIGADLALIEQEK